MGSIGLHIKWLGQETALDQFFLLDGEGNGIVDYVGLWNATKEQAFLEEQRLMGGLGSSIIKLSRKETSNLLYEYGKINISRNISFPEPFGEYDHLLKKDTSISDEELISKVCTAITEPIEFINYLTMRFVAKDIALLKYFSYFRDTVFDFVTNDGCTLLRNSVVQVGEDTFSSSAIVEEEDGYYQIKLGFSIIEEGRFYFRAILGSKREKLSHSKAESLINQSEYVAIFSHEETDLSGKLLKTFPSMYKVEFENNTLLTNFKVNNDHVKNAEYRISDDMAGVYLVKKSELIFVSLEEFYYESGLKVLKNFAEIKLIEEIFSLKPILYDYAQSSYSTIFDFLANRT